MQGAPLVNMAGHSWAAAARDTVAPIGVISESLGHGSEKFGSNEEQKSFN